MLSVYTHLIQTAYIVSLKQFKSIVELQVFTQLRFCLFNFSLRTACNSYLTNILHGVYEQNRFRSIKELIKHFKNNVR